MNRWIRPASALAMMAAAVVGAPAAPASAAAAGCATGAITSFAGLLTATSRPAVTVSGWMRPCLGTTLPASFSIVFYGRLVGVVAQGGTHGFASPTDPTPFTQGAVEYNVQGRVAELPLGICAVGPDQARVDCVRVVTQGAGLPPLVHRIPTDDPAVRKTIWTNQENPGGPGCGNCV